MQIIDKNKDYYDYLQKVYGRDTTITYDRRGSTVMSDLSVIRLIAPFTDRYDREEGAMFVVEVGELQYLFKASVDYAKVGIYSQFPEPVGGTIELLTSFSDHQHYFEKEMTLVPATRDYPYDFHWRKGRTNKYKYIPVKSFMELRVKKDRAVSNPILTDTTVASLISAQDIWIALSNHISSKYNDKTVEIVNTDVDKLQNHGFDKKSSFRHPTKL